MKTTTNFKSYLKISSFFFICLLMSPSYGSEMEGLNSLKYHFQAETVWGRVMVFVQDLHSRFNLEGQSDSPASNWFIKDSQNQIIAQGNVDAANNFKSLINRPFQDSYQLTVLIKDEEGGVPVVIKLSPGEGQIWLTPTPPPYETYKDDPEHPYDTIVKNLYNQAAEAYIEGEKDKAIDLLTKAEKVNPTQPQVLILMKKLQNSTEQAESQSIVSKTTFFWKSGDPEKALEELDGFLDHYPEDNAALQLKKRIIQAQQTKLKLKKQKIKIQKEIPVITQIIKKIAANAPDNQAQVDEAYNLGLESYRKEDYASAKKFWEQTLQLQPNHPQARRNLDRLQEEHPELK